MSWRTDAPPTNRPILGWWRERQHYMTEGRQAVVTYRKPRPAADQLRCWSNGYFAYRQPDAWRELDEPPR